MTTPREDGPVGGSGAPLVDHHCHGLVLQDLDRASFEALMNEAQRAAPRGTTFLDSMLGLAVRRWCAPVLDLEPLSDAEDYLARRLELGGAEVARRLVRAAGIDTFLVDTGIADPSACGLDELASLAGGTAREVVRLETAAERLLDDGTSPGKLGDAVRAVLSGSEAVAAKSVAAYRVGLRLPGRPPDDDQLARAVSGLRPGRGGGHRVADPVVNGWLAWAAVEAGLALQLHIGYGDRDLDLHACDPLLLTDFLRATEGIGTPVLLLHNYPFHRHAAYLCQVFDHVHMDLGLATHNTGALSTTLLRETLELVPYAKLLFATDGYGLAEHYLLGSLLFDRALATVLGELVDRGEMADRDVGHVRALVGGDNARRVYALR